MNKITKNRENNTYIWYILHYTAKFPGSESLFDSVLTRNLSDSRLTLNNQNLLVVNL